MLDIRWIRQNPDALDAALRNRGAEPLGDRLVALDDARRRSIAAVQALQTERNNASKLIGQAKGRGDAAAAEAAIAEVATLKSRIQAGEAEEAAADAALGRALALVPNVPLADVPVGGETANAEMKRVGSPREGEGLREHFDIGEALGQMRFDLAAKVAGSRFVVLMGGLARLERALGQFMIDLHTREHGYTEVAPPLLVRDEAAFGTGNLPKFAEDLFRTTDGRWLIPTAEVSLTNLVRETILDADGLPLRYTALTPCFRSEAGSAGKDTRGMLRQHQFMKCELVSITTPESSLAELERMTAAAEAILERLDLAYRRVLLSTGDMGFASQKTYDLEVWLPGQRAWREISSCSVCGDFQARRMNARFRDGEPRFVHTLNGSGVAVGRALIAIMETYQDEGGGIAIPDLLRPLMDGAARIG